MPKKEKHNKTSVQIKETLKLFDFNGPTTKYISQLRDRHNEKLWWSWWSDPNVVWSDGNHFFPLEPQLSLFQLTIINSQGREAARWPVKKRFIAASQTCCWWKGVGKGREGDGMSVEPSIIEIELNVQYSSEIWCVSTASKLMTGGVGVRRMRRCEGPLIKKPFWAFCPRTGRWCFKFAVTPSFKIFGFS